MGHLAEVNEHAEVKTIMSFGTESEDWVSGGGQPRVKDKSHVRLVVVAEPSNFSEMHKSVLRAIEQSRGSEDARRDLLTPVGDVTLNLTECVWFNSSA